MAMQLEAQKILIEEFNKRKYRNNQYSLRALSRDMGLPRTTIADVISGKRKLSLQNVKKLSEKLKLEEKEIQGLKKESSKTWGELKNDLDKKILNDDELSLIYSWQYYAILNLAKLSNNKASPAWISKQLGIPKDEAKRYLNQLKKMNLLEVKNNRMTRLAPRLQTSNDVPSRHVRDQHRQFIHLAEESIENVDLSLRDLGTITLAIDSKKIPEAKKLLLQFRRKLSDFLESDTPDTVYTLATQLFPTRTYGDNNE